MPTPDTPQPTAAGRAMSNAESAQNVPRSAPSGTAECPDEKINMGIFFDGTGNNNDDDRDWKEGSATNVAKLHKLYIVNNSTKGKAYYAGVGSLWWTKAYGGFTGAGGKSRVEKGYTALTEFFNRNNNPKATIKYIDVYGFSRGAAISRDFVNQVKKRTVPDKKRGPVRYENIPMGHGQVRKKPIYMPLPGVQVRFLGIFDTVASFGIPGNNTNIGYDFFVDSNWVKTTMHMTAEHEYRTLFPLHSIKSGPNASLPANMTEKSYPGAHSDVGGSYSYTAAKPPTEPVMDPMSGFYYPGSPGKPEKRHELAHIPLHDMYKASKNAGVELSALPSGWEWDIPGDLQGLYGRYKSDPKAFEELKTKYIHDSRYIKLWTGTRTIYYQGQQNPKTGGRRSRR